LYFTIQHKERRAEKIKQEREIAEKIELSRKKDEKQKNKWRKEDEESRKNIEKIWEEHGEQINREIDDFFNRTTPEEREKFLI
jgi:hypothetical protein